MSKVAVQILGLLLSGFIAVHLALPIMGALFGVTLVSSAGGAATVGLMYLYMFSTLLASICILAAVSVIIFLPWLMFRGK